MINLTTASPASGMTLGISPPAQKPAVKSLAVPASGLVGNPLPRCYAFINQAAQPSGWWITACSEATIFDDAHNPLVGGFRTRNAYRG